jgi:hypothetical protein
MENRNIDEDLRRLASAFYINLRISEDEYGGIGIDDKCPFGNSDVDSDIMQILDIRPLVNCPNCGYIYSDDQRAHVRDLYFNKLIPYLRKKWAEHSEG